MTDKKNFRGVYSIIPTPFTPSDEIDVEGLRRIVDFTITSGADGVVTTANASEAPYLTEAERKLVVSTIATAAAGRVPVVVGITASCKKLACEYGRQAIEVNADGLMAMPPSVQRATEAEIVDYYRAIQSTVPLPLFIQNYSGPSGTPMSAVFLRHLIEKLDQPVYIKEETDFPGPMISQLTQLCDERMLGVMGGKAGRHLTDEYRRGAIGTMPACEVTDVHAALWAALESNGEKRAAEIYRAVIPLLLFETSYGVAVYKEILRRRGVIEWAGFRQAGGKQLDAGALAELDFICRELKPYLAHYPWQ